MPRSGGGGGSNPISRGTAAEGFFPTQDVPIHGLGTALLNVALHPIMQQRAEDETARYKKEVLDPRQQTIADGVNSYSQQLQAAGGNEKAALASFIKTREGLAVFQNPDAFKAVMALHQVQSQLSNDPNPPPQTTDIGHGLIGVQVGGKWSVQKTPVAKAGAAERPIKGPDGNLYTRDPNNPAGLIPMRVTDQTAGAGGSYDAKGDYVPPAASNAPPEHFGTGKMLASQGNILTAGPDMYQGLQVMGALSGKATGLPTGFLQHLGGVYAGVNDPAAMWDIAKRQVENGAAKLYAGGGGGAPGMKEFISNLPSYNDAPRYNVALANSLQRSIYNTTKTTAALAEQRIGGSLPLAVQQTLEPMGIYATSKQANDPWAILKNNPHALSDDQMEHMWANDRFNHSPEEQKALIAENDRRLQAAQSQPQPQAPPAQQAPAAAPLPSSNALGAPTGGPAAPLSPEDAAKRYLGGQGSPQDLMQGVPGTTGGAGLPQVPEAAPPQQPPGSQDLTQPGSKPPVPGQPGLEGPVYQGDPSQTPRSQGVPSPQSTAVPAGGGVGATLAQLNPISAVQAAEMPSARPAIGAGMSPSVQAQPASMVQPQPAQDVGPGVTQQSAQPQFVSGSPLDAVMQKIATTPDFHQQMQTYLDQVKSGQQPEASAASDQASPGQSARAAIPPAMAPDRGAEAGATTQLTDQDRQLLAQIATRMQAPPGVNPMQAAQQATAPLPSSNQEGQVIPLPPRQPVDNSVGTQGF